MTFGVEGNFVGVNTFELDEAPRWAGAACCARDAEPPLPRLLDAGGLVACAACTADNEGRAASTCRQGPPVPGGDLTGTTDGEDPAIGRGIELLGVEVGAGLGGGLDACVSAMILLRSTLSISFYLRKQAGEKQNLPPRLYGL